MSSDETLSLATAQDFSSDTIVPIAGGTLDINENSRTGLFSTAGSTSYTFRGDIGDFTMASDQDKGDQVFVYQLTPWNTTDATLSSLAEKFIYYSISSVSIVFKCIAPWSTASGSMQFFYNPDPENALSATPADALKQAMRLLQSKQLSSKGEGAVVCNVPAEKASQVFKGMRYCKPAKNSMPRTESFGYIGGVVRGVPSIGDGTQWTATVVTTFVFVDPTLNLTTSVFELVISDAPTSSTVVSTTDGSGMIYISTVLPTTGKIFAGNFLPYNIDNNFVILSETQGEATITERYFYTNNSTFCVDDGTSLVVWLRTTFSPSTTALDDPETATVETDLALVEGSVIYNEDVLGPSSTRYQYAPRQSNRSFLNALRSQRVTDKKKLLTEYKSVLAVTKNK